MGEFNIEFARGVPPGPQYLDYLVSVTSLCSGDGLPRDIKFNDTTGDFIVGYNYSNPYSGLPAQSLRIESFTDVAYFVEISTGTTTIVTPYTPNTLRDISTGSDLTYPYIVPISNLANIQQHISTAELICSEDSNYSARRVRELTYIIMDSAGTPGPLRIATFQNTSD